MSRGSSPDAYAMTPWGSGGRITWIKRVQMGERFSETITWRDLLRVAEKCYDWLRSNHADNVCFSRGGQGSCLVAALFAPRPGGGMIFLSTIPQVDRAQELRDSGPTHAPRWFAANNSRREKYHAEDGAIFNFECDPSTTSYVPGMRMAVWGAHEQQGDGGMARICNGESSSKMYPHPSCRAVCAALNIECADGVAVEAERSDNGGNGGGGHRHTTTVDKLRQNPPANYYSQNNTTWDQYYQSGGHDQGGPSDYYGAQYAAPPQYQPATHRSRAKPKKNPAPSDHLSGLMGSLSLGSKASGTSSSSSSSNYWKWDSKNQKYYHRHSSGKISWA